MNTHTPGPWVADDGDGCDWVVAANDGECIALLYMTTAHEVDAKANATLMAAAPDMLDALCTLRSMWGEFIAGDSYYISTTLKETVGNAIRKALPK